MVYPTIRADSVGWITEVEMIEVDRVMIEDLRIELVQMMENAGRNLARLVLDLYSPTRVSVVAGSGGNGGGGMVAARHLANAGVEVSVTTTRPAAELTPVPAHQFDILQRMGVPVEPEVTHADVVIDSVIGYSLKGAPRGRSEALIAQINAAQAAVVSLDTPSGLNVNSGETPGIAVMADATLTLALPKIGMRMSPSVGELFLADISVPRSVTQALGPAAPDFSESPIVHVSA